MDHTDNRMKTNILLESINFLKNIKFLEGIKKAIYGIAGSILII